LRNSIFSERCSSQLAIFSKKYTRKKITTKAAPLRSSGEKFHIAPPYEATAPAKVTANMKPASNPASEKNSRKSPLKYPLKPKSAKTTTRIRSTQFTDENRRGNAPPSAADPVRASRCKASRMSLRLRTIQKAADNRVSKHDYERP